MVLLKEKPVEDVPRMQCMEIWGGNRATTNSFRAPGLDIHVYCAPYGASQDGGDIYYLTSCASGRISRLLLVDVAGHGQEASQLAIKLRDLLRSNVNRISQKQFVESMNREFTDGGARSYATAIVATYFAPRRSLSLSLAGHPNPIYYSVSKKRWSAIERAQKRDKSPSNLPLGVIEESAYPSYQLTTSAADMFLLYSDAFIESVDQRGQQIGIQGIVDRLNQIESVVPDQVIPQLIELIQSESADNLKQDDTTAILGSMTQVKTSWKDNLLAPLRIFQNVRDRTALTECC